MYSPTEEQMSAQTLVTPRFGLQTVSWSTWLFVIALLAGSCLRLWQINAVGFNSDEVVYTSQAAVMVNDPSLSEFFPIFRAHPLLYQYILAVVFALFGVSDLVARLVSVGVGLATIGLVYKTGELLYGKPAGALSALFLALMPYHVVVTRQVLLDGPMTLCATLALYLLARFAQSERSVWLYASGAAIGLTFLAKETGIVRAGALFAFLSLTPKLRLRLRDLLYVAGALLIVAAAYPLTPRLAGAEGVKTTGQYLTWQLFRRPNHDWSFYLTTVPWEMGLLLLLAAGLGLWLLRRQASWRESLLLAWLLVPTLFFQLWPVKGFHYLLLGTVPVALLAARTFVNWPGSTNAFTSHSRRVTNPLGHWLPALGGAVVVCSLLLVSLNRIGNSGSLSGLAGSGGVPGGRAIGEWIKANVPEGASFMTLGPSMANIIQFYGQRRAYGISVSPNPLHRNPSYPAIINPDFQLRSGEIQYIAWDAFGPRSAFFEQKLLDYLDRYQGRVIHQESVQVRLPSGEWSEKPVMIIYEVRP